MYVASNMGFGGRRNQEDGLGSQLQASLLNLEAGVSETPELIYDGPFADQMLNRKPVGLPQNKLSMEEAQQAAIEFFGEDRVQDVEAFELGENINEARIPAYTFNLFPNNQQRELAVYMGVAQQGGKVLRMSNPRPISNAQISVKGRTICNRIPKERVLKHGINYYSTMVGYYLTLSIQKMT